MAAAEAGGPSLGRAAAVLALTVALAACGSDGDDAAAQQVGELEARVAELESALADRATTTTAVVEDDPAEQASPVAPCEPWSVDGVTEQLSHACEVSCSTATAFADLGTNPGLNDLLAYDVAYYRIVGLDGAERAVGTEVTAGTTAVEMVGVYTDASDPNARTLSAYYSRWSPEGTSTGEAESIYDAYWVSEGPEVGIDYSEDAFGWEIDHPLRATAQFLDTPVGCLPNPHRADGAADSVSPPVESSAETAPSEDSAEAAVGRWVDEEVGSGYLGPCSDDLSPGTGLCSVHLGGRGAGRVVLALGEPSSEYYIWLLVEEQDGTWGVVDEYLPEDSYDLSDAPEWVEA